MDQNLADAYALGVTDVSYTFAGTPSLLNGCTTNDPTSCGTNTNAFPVVTPPFSCGNTYPAGCILPPDVNKDGTGTDAGWKNFVTALANHVYGVTAGNRYCAPGYNQPYLNCHAKIVFWDPWNEWDRDNLTKGTQTGQTIYATYAQMQRMTADLSAIVKGSAYSSIVSAKVTTPSMAGFSQKVEQNFLYCNYPHTQTQNCSETLLGNVLGVPTPSKKIDVYIVHNYIRLSSGAPESILTEASNMLSWLTWNGVTHTAEINAWMKNVWIQEGSWGCDNPDNGPGSGDGCNGNSQALQDYDLQAAFTSRYLLEGWSAGFTRIYWYAADNCGYPNGMDNGPFGVGTLFGGNAGCTRMTAPVLKGLWWSGKAWNQTAAWMTGKTLIQSCGIVSPYLYTYTCEFRDASNNTYLAVYDSSKTCSGATDPTQEVNDGTCGTSSYLVPSPYNQYQTLDPAAGTIPTLPGSTIQVGPKPIWLSSTVGTGPAGSQAMNGAFTIQSCFFKTLDGIRELLRLSRCIFLRD